MGERGRGEDTLSSAVVSHEVPALIQRGGNARTGIPPSWFRTMNQVSQRLWPRRVDGWTWRLGGHRDTERTGRAGSPCGMADFRISSLVPALKALSRKLGTQNWRFTWGDLGPAGALATAPLSRHQLRLFQYVLLQEEMNDIF